MIEFHMRKGESVFEKN